MAEQHTQPHIPMQTHTVSILIVLIYKLKKKKLHTHGRNRKWTEHNDMQQQSRITRGCNQNEEL